MESILLPCGTFHNLYYKHLIRKRKEMSNNEFSNKSGEDFLGSRVDNQSNAINRQEEADGGDIETARTRRQKRLQTPKTPATRTKTS